jgi:hypothetical protein
MFINSLVLSLLSLYLRILPFPPSLSFRTPPSFSPALSITHSFSVLLRPCSVLILPTGKFKMPAAEAGTGKRTTMAEMAADLLRLEGEQIDVLPATTHAGDTDILSDADLEALLDRSPEVFADRGTGWRSSAKGQAAFAVFEPPPDAGNDALAGMMGEEVAEE